ncbi:MAG: hypothetical protein NVS2B16_21510 [Chloroflexota bacterium]
MTSGNGPDSARIVLPILHLMYSCSPVGITLHLSEIAWGLRSRHYRRAIVPLLHLACAPTPLGILLHMGECAWSYLPFLTKVVTNNPSARIPENAPNVTQEPDRIAAPFLVRVSA